MSFDKIVRPKRGERRARYVIKLMGDAGLEIFAAKSPDGKWGVRFPGPETHTKDQRKLAVDVSLFCIGYPRCFGTMVRLLREREAVV